MTKHILDIPSPFTADFAPEDGGYSLSGDAGNSA